MNMNTLLHSIKQAEGLRLKPYRCTEDKLTIGYGRNLEDVGLSSIEAEYLLENDIGQSMIDLDNALPWWRDLSDIRQEALVEMCFNMGLPTLLEFENMLAALETGQYAKASEEALDSKWARQVGDRALRIANMIREG